MSEYTKDDLSFLVEAMDARSFGKRDGVTGSARVKGEMSIPEPIKVDCRGNDMDPEVYKKCSTIMAVCMNMVQKMLTDAALEKNIPPATALKNLDAWVAAFVDFPLPVFNFTEMQSQTSKQDEFVLSANADVVESIVNIKGVAELKEAVVKALRASGEKGNLVSYSKQDKDFTYFGLITGYKSTSIDVRVVSYRMHMKNTEVKILCGGSSKTTLDSSYDTYVFSSDSAMMVKLAEKMGDKIVEVVAKNLLTFIETFYDDQLRDYKVKLRNIFGPK